MEMEMYIDDIGTVVKDKDLFKDWFVRTYFQKFNEKPIIITKIDLKALRDMEDEKEKEQINKYLKEVIHVVSTSLFGEDLSNAVLGKARTKDVILVRKASLYIVCNMLKFSKPFAAEIINKERTTVLHHCKTISGILQVDKVFKTKFEGILKKLEERDLITLKYKNKEAKIFRKE
jgi:chromosomal replication initiation ATPase DnaA